MSHDRTKNELYNVEPLNNQAEPLHGPGYSPQFGDIKDIRAEATITVYGKNPSVNIATEYLVKAAGLASNLGEIQNVLTGGYSTAVSLTQLGIEASFSPNTENLAKAANTIQQRNFTQYGFEIYVRIQYQEYANGWFSNGWEEKYSDWEQYTEGGDIGGAPGIVGLPGHYDSVQEAKRDIGKAMKWEMKRFISRYR